MFNDVFKEFRQFLMRGNVVDLAVAVVIGSAFTAIVNALVKDLITPLLAAVGGKPDFSKLSFTVNKSVFLYGDFLNQVISFVIIASVVFFLVIQPINHLMRITRRGKTEDPTTRKCLECLSEIALEARRCMYCTSPVPVPPEKASK